MDIENNKFEFKTGAREGHKLDTAIKLYNLIYSLPDNVEYKIVKNKNIVAIYK